MVKKSQYKSLAEWERGNPAAYQAANVRGMIDELCNEYGWIKKKLWTKDECIEIANRFSSRTDWAVNHQSTYNAARNKGWFEECVKHMVNLKKDKFSKNDCIQDAIKYNHKKDWILKGNSAYNTARINGWLDECCAHMTPLRKPTGYWSKEKCIEDAKKYNYRNEWQINAGRSYQAAQSNGWIDECCQHMTIINKPKGYWTKEKCIEDAKKYKTRNEWKINGYRSYNSASKNHWIDECSQHMISGRKNKIKLLK